MAKNDSKTPDFKQIPEYVVKKAKGLGADDVVCSAVKSTTRQVRFANSSVTASKVYDTVMTDIFIVWKKRVVNSEIYDIGELDSALKDMLSLAKVTSENKDYYKIASGSFKYRDDRPDKKIIGLDEEKIMDFVESGINSATKSGAKRVAGTLYTSSSDEVLATSNGIYCDEQGADIEISMRAFAEKDASGHGVSCSTTLRDFSPEEAGKKAGGIAKMGLAPKEGTPGKYSILWEPIAFANFIDHVGGSASAFDVDAGLSFFKDKIGQKVASDIVTIYDDGTIPDGLSSSKCDSEGVPTRKTTLIENGVLRNYLHNSSTAHKFKTETTGNAGLVSPRPWNIVFKPGDRKKEELLRDVGNGLYITNVWYTRFQNYINGDFSTIPRDAIFEIRNGEISGVVKGLRVTENMLKLLQSITAVGREQEQIHWWEVNTPVFMPYVVTKDVNVTKSTQ